MFLVSGFILKEASVRRVIMSSFMIIFALAGSPAITTYADYAEGQRHSDLLKLLHAKQTNRDFANEARGGGNGAREIQSFDFNGRITDMYVPDKAPASGARTLLVVLHGGMGNSRHVRRSLQMDVMADKYGFLIAYLNGNPSRISASGAYRN